MSLNRFKTNLETPSIGTPERIDPPSAPPPTPPHATMGGVDDLVLDPRIRDWVLLPIVVVMVLIGICRTMAQRMMASQAKQDIEQVKQQYVHPARP